MSLAAPFEQDGDGRRLKQAFLKWQCRVRQMAMRDHEGRPDDAIMPVVILRGESEPLGHVITVLNKLPRFSVTAELTHMARKTNDPAQVRDQAIRFFSATHYQKHREFSDVLTATFPPGSPGAARICAAGACRLLFDAFSQRFDLHCEVERLDKLAPDYLATAAHNRLFNTGLHPDTEILAFRPDWLLSSADPSLG